MEANSDLRRARALFLAATQEWHELAEALCELRDTLEPADFELALAKLELPDLGRIRSEWAEDERSCQTPEIPLPDAQAPVAQTTPQAAAQPPPPAPPTETAPAEVNETAAVALTAEQEAQVTALVDAVESQTAESSSSDTIAIENRLEEMLGLLKQHLSASQTAGGQGVQLPQHVTMAIAREVAGPRARLRTRLCA